MLTKQEKQNFKEAIADLNKSIPKEKKELQEAKKCLEYFHPDMNYYDENIEKKVVAILEFYINDVEEAVDVAKRQKKCYEDILKRGYV